MKRRTMTVLGLTLAGTLGSVGVAGAADAATSGAVLDAALTVLGIEVDDVDLRDELVDGIGSAIDDGVVDGDLVEGIVEGDPAVDDEVGERLRETTGRWGEIAPTWRLAYGEARSEFQSCVDGLGEDEPASECAAGLVASLREARVGRETPAVTAPGRPADQTPATSRSTTPGSSSSTPGGGRPDGAGNAGGASERPGASGPASNGSSQRGANAPGQQGRS